MALVYLYLTYAEDIAVHFIEEICVHTMCSIALIIQISNKIILHNKYKYLMQLMILGPACLLMSTMLMSLAGLLLLYASDLFLQ